MNITNYVDILKDIFHNHQSSMEYLRNNFTTTGSDCIIAGVILFLDVYSYETIFSLYFSSMLVLIAVHWRNSVTSKCFLFD